MATLFARTTPAPEVEDIWDQTKAEHANTYKSGIRPFSDDLYICQTDSLCQFLKDLHVDHADEMEWSEGILLSVTFNPAEDGNHKEDFIENYGMLPIDECE